MLSLLLEILPRNAVIPIDVISESCVHAHQIKYANGILLTRINYERLQLRNCVELLRLNEIIMVSMKRFNLCWVNWMRTILIPNDSHSIDATVYESSGFIMNFTIWIHASSISTMIQFLFEIFSFMSNWIYQNIHCTRIKATFYALFKLTFSVGEHTTAVKPMRTHYHCKIFKSNIWCTNCITRSFSLLSFLRNFANTFQILNEHQAALSWTSSSSIFFSWTPTCFISIHEHRPYK